MTERTQDQIDAGFADLAQFDGETYVAKFDWTRLSAQLMRVYDVMADGRWRTLSEISMISGDGSASISARLRDLRKDRFGAHEVLRRRRGEGKRGLFEYSLKVIK